MNEEQRRKLNDLISDIITARADLELLVYSDTPNYQAAVDRIGLCRCAIITFVDRLLAEAHIIEETPGL